MRTNFGAKPYLYPMPVLIIASYNENGTANAMNAAWGCIADTNQIAIYVSASHKTMENILNKKAFTVSPATEKTVKEADFFGVVSGNKIDDKVTQAGLHHFKSERVNAPVIQEFPLTLECQFISYNHESELLVGEIVNVSCEEDILTEGKVDVSKLCPISFDPINHTYLKIGSLVGNAFNDGLSLKKE